MATHEAGHGIAALATGRFVRRITIVPTKTLDGFTNMRSPTDTKRDRQKAMIASVSGNIAERGRPSLDQRSGDRNRFINTLAREPPGAMRRRAMRAMVRAMTIDRRYRRAIRALAAELEQHGVLKGPTIKRIAFGAEPVLRRAYVRARLRRR